MKRARWKTWLTLVVGVLSIARAVVYFTSSDDHPTSSVPVSFSPTGGPAVDTSLPTDVLTALPSIDPAAIPTDIPSDAPTVAPLGPVRYEITGNGTRAGVRYTDADLDVRGGEHLRLPYTRSVAGGFGTYFYVNAQAQDGTSVTCRILAHHGVVEATRTTHARHGSVTCEWRVPDSP